MVGRSKGRRGVGRRRALSDGGRRTDGNFYFFLEPPIKKFRFRNLGIHTTFRKKITEFLTINFFKNMKEIYLTLIWIDLPAFSSPQQN